MVRRKEPIYNSDKFCRFIKSLESEDTEFSSEEETEISNAIEFVSENNLITLEQLDKLTYYGINEATQIIQEILEDGYIDPRENGVLNNMLCVQYVKENIINLKAERTVQSKELF